MATKKPPDPPRPMGTLGSPSIERVAGLFGGDANDDTDNLAAAAVAVRSMAGAPAPTPTSALSAGPARVEYQTADSPPRTRILGDTTTVGRHTDNDIQLLDPEVSKAHLVVRRTKDGFDLEDLGSANGTTVNNQRVTRHRIKDGDVVTVGNSVLRFRLERPRSPLASEPPRNAADIRPAMRPAAGDGARPLDTPMEPERPAPLSSFADVRKSDPLFAKSTGKTGELPRMPRPEELSRSLVRGPHDPPSEHTSVTLLPSHLLSDAADSVFAEQAADAVDFDVADRVADERVLRRDYERLRVAFDLFTNVGLETDLEALGGLIVEKIRGVLPCDSAVVMLRDPAISDDLVMLASYSDQNQAVHIPRAIVERVLATKSGLLTSDAQVDQQLRRSETIVGARIRSALCVPLVVRGEVLGAIHLSSTSVAGAYGEKDLSLLRAIAQPAALAVANARLRRKIEEEAATRAELSRFLSPALVEKAVRNELDFSKAGDKVQCSILFSDIRGFTTISDGANPEQVVSMLNEYFDTMVEIVFEHGGTLDKFLGDGMMAVWGTPIVAADDALRAVRAARSMRAALDRVVNAARVARGEEPLSVGFGIATGRVVAGAMGARRRLDFTVIGDTVNLASRLCGQAKPGQILVDDTTNRLIQHELNTTALEPRQVKGFARPVAVYDVEAITAPDFDPLG